MLRVYEQNKMMMMMMKAP